MPCTMSRRPPAVLSERMRRPYSSNGVAPRIWPTPTTRRPLSGMRCGIRIRSAPASPWPGAVLTTLRFETMVRVSSSSHIRTAVPPPGFVPPSASGAIATPGRSTKRPCSTRPSASSTSSDHAGPATSRLISASRAAGRVQSIRVQSMPSLSSGMTSCQQTLVYRPSLPLAARRAQSVALLDCAGVTGRQYTQFRGRRESLLHGVRFELSRYGWNERS